jgi:transposase
MSRRGHSLDLRERVIDALDKGMTQEKAAEVFSVGTATVYRWERLRRERGSIEPLPHGGGNPRAIDGAGDELLKALVAEKPDRFLPELTAELNKRVPRPASTSSVSRALERLGLSRKETLSAVEKDRPDVVARTEAFKREVASIDSSKPRAPACSSSRSTRRS